MIDLIDYRHVYRIYQENNNVRVVYVNRYEEIYPFDNEFQAINFYNNALVRHTEFWSVEVRYAN